MKEGCIRELQPGLQIGVSGLFGNLPSAAHAPLPPKADGDKLGEVRVGLLRDAFPELLPDRVTSPLQTLVLSCSPVPDGLFQIGALILLA